MYKCKDCLIKEYIAKYNMTEKQAKNLIEIAINEKRFPVWKYTLYGTLTVCEICGIEKEVIG